MAQKTQIVCDKCGKEIVNPYNGYSPTYRIKDFSARITLYGVGEARYGTGQRIDLCPECYEKFVNFLEEGD